MGRFLVRLLLFLAIASLVAISLTAQQCPLPPSPFEREANIFSPEQEMYLGDAVAQQVEGEFSVVKDDQLNQHLRKISERLLRALPPDGRRYQFFLFDQPVANAWGLPGGRVYISRKMVAFARSEDELAGILAHEIGHIYTHQQALDFTRWFKEILHVTQVAGRDDIFNRYHQLLETRKKGGISQKREEREQAVADQLALYAVARAGYNMRAFADIWDRLTESKGNTGGFWSDFFGTTTPESKRLREMLKTTAAMPTACIEQQPVASQDDFRKWQSDVIAYSPSAAKEQLHGVLLKRTLEPPLQAELSHLRFSPDGKYLLAQDDGGITVLSREPPAALFHIEAENAYPARFTADSQSVLFHTSSLRVESWSVAQRKRDWVRELVLPEGCYQSALSPDGKYLACYRANYSLGIIEVASGTLVFEKKNFYRPDMWVLFSVALAAALNERVEFNWMHLSFSPDGNYLIAARQDALLLYDVSRRSQISLPGTIQQGVRQGFTFLANDHIAVIAGDHGEKSAVLRFPTGERLATFTLGQQRIVSATDSRYLLLRPIKDLPVGIFDWGQNKMLTGSRRDALDVYDGIVASEARDGQIALSRLGEAKTQTVSYLQLPLPPLAGLRVTQISDDLNLLALSLTTRGAIFDLQNGKRLFAVRGFGGAYFGDDGVVYADFPKYEATARTVARMKIKDGSVNAGEPLAEDLYATQRGQYLLVRKSARKQQTWRDVTLEVQDIRTGTVLWSRSFSDQPRTYANTMADTLALLWSADSAAAKEAAKQSPELRRKFESIRRKDDAYYLEVVELHSGKRLGRLLVDTKDAFHLHGLLAAGDFVAVTDSQNRVLVYRLSSGEQSGKLFGSAAQLSASGLLSIADESGAVALYDAATMQKRGEYVFPVQPAFLQFSKDGNRMLAVLKNQTVYVLDLKFPPTAPLATTSAP